MTAPPKIYPYEPRFHFEPPDLPDIQSPNKPPPPNWPLPFIPNFRGLPSGVKPTVDGYPWWVDPPGFLNPPPAPELPPFQLGPTDYANRLQGSPTNWLQSYYDQNFPQQGWPQPNDGSDPTPQDDTSQQDVPERRLGRRTDRA